MMTYTFHNELHDAHCYSCSNKYFRVITIVSEKGCLHQCEVWFCTCESEFSKLLKYDLWPSTPTKPSTAISIKLLDQFVALQMEGKISFTSFIDGMSWKTGMHNQTLKRVLTRFMQTDSIDQYRQFQRQLRDLWFSDLTGKKPNQCPACPIDAGSVFYCMDANFGLVLKSSASKSKNTPNNDKNHFIEDDEVDTFMSSYDDKAVENKECNNFQAGNRIRSKRKSSKLSVTGVFGVSCRHEIPKLFLNMRHGERIGYAVLMMNKILAEVLGKDIDVHIMYDIACLLKKHLTKKGTLSKYPKFKLGIPVFHAYGHKSSCQVQHSIRRMEGFGLMDGELMERLWSYLRSFSKITKEMTSAHRVDFLSDALNHFTMTKLEILGKTLVGWYQKANAVYQTSSAEIQTLCLNLDNITDEVIHSWKLEEESKIKWKSVVEQEVGWEFKYYTKIKELNNENTLLLLSSSVSDTARHRIKLNRLESGLSSFEKKHDVNDRWSITSNQYTYHHRKFVQNAVKTTLDTLHTRATERLMLLTLKKRYADGSSICNRLSVQINKICNDLKNLVESLNQTNRECGVYEDVLYKDALDVNSRIYLNTTTVDQVNNTSHNIPASVYVRTILPAQVSCYRGASNCSYGNAARIKLL
ncbi:uncharacterized protein LOC130628863 [Hydractinia symbiolongicarpus]|uniref:uncharacterized protein LOC130628863 n=1 Tax=Hydractinia symbiolongicarpus TaxID=13093 RepID=UPI00254E6947|nr:uncharacterized protein LOC130628863 [Hydractinia symbiolongicarpus]XP_057297874.1 uncharacterized protein LOC130628863 [Hydractinia symbiolongicarpus]XP_057297875.1 uncharacterized protein LOC130628863 [Hydractinia symbiolongicarpus]